MLKNLVSNRLNLILVSVVILLLLSGYVTYQRVFVKSSAEQIVEEVDLTFDPEGPYALIYPRRDGNALVLNIKRTGSYDQIKYELSYNSEGVDRGAQGDINTKEKKGEYEQEILFGSCSTGGKCVYDKNVENGTLVLHIRKGELAFRMVSQWHLQKPDVALGVLTSGDNHFTYKISSPAADLALVQYTIINDLSGAPKLPEGKNILGKAYVVNPPVAKNIPSGVVSIELPENAPAETKIARFDEVKNSWVEFETKNEDGKLSATVDGGGVITVLVPKNK